MTCPLCEAMCGLTVRVSDGHVRDVRGNHDDVWSRGHLCPKGASLGQVHHDPDRLRLPLVKKRNGDHEAVSWDDALAECERVLRPVLDTYGARALTVYIGNPVAHNIGLSLHVGALIGFGQAAGMQAYYSPGTVDQWPLNVVSALVFGGMWNGPIPDLAHTDHLVVLGANPSASQGSMLSSPDIMGELGAIAERGKVVVVDPRRTQTAQRATEWIPIRPGTDALLLFAILNVLDDNDWLRRPDHLRDRVSGLDEVVALAKPFTPERVADQTGDLRAHDPTDGRGTRACRTTGAVQPNRHVHTGIRHALDVVGVRRQRGDRCARQRRWRGLPQTRRLVADVHEAPGPAN